MEANAKLQEELLEVKRENRELMLLVMQLQDRIERLENRDIGGGIFLDGVDERYKTVIQKSLTAKERGDVR